jgi:CCR4-NOT transcriptional complex subunit CAF120
VFKLYGRPDRYVWDRTNPKSFFFAYPEGPNRDSLFLDTEEALLADLRTANLPAVRANFVAITRRKLSEPPIEPAYRDEKASASSPPPPRPDGAYRLPPLTFDGPSPNLSSESQPRSLTPITERTDDASRQNSTRTNNSGIYERRPSEQSLKQGSGSSARNPSGGEERLAPITDEGPGHHTDEPAAGVVTSPESTIPGVGGIAPDRGMGTQETLDSRTGETMWSQPSADQSQNQSQSGASTPTSHAHAGVAHFSQLPPIVTSRGTPLELERPGDKNRLPDIPSGTGPQSTRLAQPIDAEPEAQTGQERSITPQAQAVPTPQVQPVSQAPPTSQVLTAPAQHQLVNEQIHTPTPRKVSSGELVSSPEKGLSQEPAAIYLQNMVDEPQIQHLAPAPRDTRVRSPSDTGSLSSIGRKPSGARAPPPRKSSTGPLRALSAVDEHGQPIPALSPPVSAVGMPTANTHEQVTTPRKLDTNLPRSTTHDDLGEDVSAFVAYADQPSPEMDKGKGKEKELAPPPKQEADVPRSSFALSKAAAERRARAEETAAEQERAKRMPGGGKRTGPIRKDQWMESDSDEDEEEDEEQDSPEVPKRSTMVQQPRAREGEYQDQGLDRSGSRARALPSIPRPANGPERGYTPDQERYLSQSQTREQDRQRPNSRSPNPNPNQRPNPQYRDTYADRDRMSMAPPRSQYEVQRPAQGRTPPPGNSQQNRQSVWNANFAADHGMHENKSGKFVEMEDPAAQLTKPFAPHGLLQAGLQDREDRSAKRQEELARETGTSLINVPSKPPPPQTGLLGAVAAHERERKNAGGIGATLTDRERERRQNVSLDCD